VHFKNTKNTKELGLVEKNSIITRCEAVLVGLAIHGGVFNFTTTKMPSLVVSPF